MPRMGRQKIVIEEVEDGSWSVSVYRSSGERWRLQDTATYDKLADALNWRTIRLVGDKHTGD